MDAKEARRQQTGSLKITGTIEMVEGTRREFSTQHGQVASQQLMVTTAEQPPRRVVVEASGTVLAEGERLAASGGVAAVYYTPRPRISLGYDYRTGQRAVPQLEWATARGLADMASMWELWTVNVASHVVPAHSAAPMAQKGGVR